MTQSHLAVVTCVLAFVGACAPTSMEDTTSLETASESPLSTQPNGLLTLEPTAESAPGAVGDRTEACSAVLTPPNPEGPFYSPGAPERSSLVEPGSGGTRILLSGRVMTLDCEPIPGALLDFWQTDEFGEYDNEGFKFRGTLFADEEGEYQLETVLPGLYPGRPAHIHVKVTPPGGADHTTQIYFPGAEMGSADQFVDAALVATLSEDSNGNLIAGFDFVLAP